MEYLIAFHHRKLELIANHRNFAQCVQVVELESRPELTLVSSTHCGNFTVSPTRLLVIGDPHFLAAAAVVINRFGRHGDPIDLNMLSLFHAGGQLRIVLLGEDWMWSPADGALDKSVAGGLAWSTLQLDRNVVLLSPSGAGFLSLITAMRHTAGKRTPISELISRLTEMGLFDKHGRGLTRINLDRKESITQGSAA